MARIHLLKSVQFFPVPPEEVWQFFADPRNLERITPPFLHLKVTNKLFGPETYAGQLISYKVRPLLGIPLGWLTEITHLNKPHLFVDEQRKGPYALWHHEHHFQEMDGGTEMTDLVHFALPFGFLGAMALPMVKNKLREIFLFRHREIARAFQLDQAEPVLEID